MPFWVSYTFHVSQIYTHCTITITFIQQRSSANENNYRQSTICRNRKKGIPVSSKGAFATNN